MVEVEEAEQLYGLLAEFDAPEPLVAAARRAHAAGYRAMDAYTPFPVEGLSAAIGFRRTWLQALVFLAGLGGCVGAFAMQYLSATWHYPITVAGRPYNSWPAFVPLMFELTVLAASLTALVVMIGLNGLPRPHHPLFGSELFERATRDRFFLCIEARDPRFDRHDTRRFLEELGPLSISEIPRAEEEGGA
jgi:hypothetical protein